MHIYITIYVCTVRTRISTTLIPSDERLKIFSVTMPSYGTEFQAFFLRSNSEVFRTLGGLMEIVPSAMDGLNGVATKR